MKRHKVTIKNFKQQLSRVCGKVDGDYTLELVELDSAAQEAELRQRRHRLPAQVAELEEERNG